MSSDIFVRARGMGKKYELFDHPFGHLTGTMFGRSAGQHVWALRDFDLDARPGDFIGIIGRNGAGKSTLLELVTGVLTPNRGHVEVSGRVAALLELGAGFNADFTGRENAELCASVYGLTPNQIADRLPAIEAFAGVGDFIDRPTREYSSGMYARLAFAISINVDADILIVDEILGVGDVRFQQRSMKFLREFSKRGIVLFVSHNEAAILSLCNSAIWLSKGQAVIRGAPKKVMQAYHTAMSQSDDGSSEFQKASSPDNQAVQSLAAVAKEIVSEDAEDAGPLYYDFDGSDNSERSGTLSHVELHSNGQQKTVFEGGEEVVLSIHCHELGASQIFAAFVVRDAFGQVIFSRDTLDGTGTAISGEKTNMNVAEFSFTLPFLPSGNYAIDAAVVEIASGKLKCLDRRDTAAAFSVQSRHISAGLANVRMLETRMLIDGEPIK